MRFLSFITPPIFITQSPRVEEKRRDMGRPPCCEKIDVKKGPWTPEEDIILVTYIQEHGPGNWRSVPTNTGIYNIYIPSVVFSLVLFNCITFQVC